MRIQTLLSVVVSSLFVAFVSGCEDPGPQLPRCIPVSGQVLIDGAPAVRSVVALHPSSPYADGKTYVGQTFTDDNGQFKMTTFNYGDGVPAGDYTVTIVAEWVSKNGQDVGVKDLLGGVYATPEKSPLKLKVESKPIVLEPYNLKKK
ncbi:transthyretin-like family protein [Lacunimicrobium album]